jgi:hypothetical protein
MRYGIYLAGWAGLLIAVCAAGCNAERKPPAPAPADEGGAVRARFAEVQAALKAGDADKLWPLLNEKSHADAERTARKVRAAYAEANPEGKAKLEEAVGLRGAELAGLTGKGFLKSERFRGKYRDVPGSAVEKVALEGDNATVYYLEEDGDKEKMILVREGGAWKVWLTMPAVKLP